MKIPVISLFTGAMGLDLGLEAAGFETKVAVECNKYAAATIRANRPNLTVIEDRIENISTERILKAANLKAGDEFIVVGGPACQAFSTVGRRGSLQDDRGTLFREFLRVVKEAKPKFFVMENVKGIISAAINHRPLNQRGPGFPPLTSDELLGSAFTVVTKEISSLGGYTVFDLLNAADFGAPQKRDRIIFIGSLEGIKVETPQPTHSELAEDGLLPWVNLQTALKDLKEKDQTYATTPANIAKYLPKIPEGGNWKNLPLSQQEDAIGKGAYRSWGGRTGFLRRLSWSKPSPSLTTSPINKATFFGHPQKNRPLSVQEFARIQGFPDTWAFSGSLSERYKQIGNAVPIALGAAIGTAINNAIDNNKKANQLGQIVCPNTKLLKSLEKRNLTQLNPPEMSGITCPKEIKNWEKESREWLKKIEQPSQNLFLYLTAEIVS